MNSSAMAYSTATSRVGRLPWLMFLFLAAVFFLSQHDLFYSSRVTLNLSVDDLIAGVVAGSLSRRVALVALALFAAAATLSLRGVRLRVNGSMGWVMLFFAGWAVLSLWWAEDTQLTLRRLVVFAILCFAAAGIARRFSPREIVLLMFFCSMVFLVIGVSAEVLLGTFRPFIAGYRFAGTLHPNQEGINCALLLLSGVAAADTENRGRMLFRSCAAVGLVFLILTASRTAFAAAVVALLVYLATRRYRRDRMALGIGLGIAFCLLLLLAWHTPYSSLQRVALLGREDTPVESFDGRTSVWDQCASYVTRRPMTGYGFGGFWTPKHISEISASQNWGVAEGHSAYVDCLLNLGLVGLVAYVFALVAGIWRSFVLHRISQNSAFAFVGAFLIFCVADGLLESAVVASVSLTFFVAAVLIHLGFGPHVLVRLGQDRRSA